MSARSNFLPLPLGPSSPEVSFRCCTSCSRLEKDAGGKKTCLSLWLLVQFIELETKRWERQSWEAACDQSPEFCLCAFMHTSEKESFSSGIYTAGIISVVLRVCCMFAVIYHIQQYTMAQDLLWQGARVNCDHSWYFCGAYSRIAGL